MKLEEIEALFQESCRLYPKYMSSFMFIHFRKLLDVAKAAKYLDSGAKHPLQAIKHLRNKLEDLEGPSAANEVLTSEHWS